MPSLHRTCSYLLLAALPLSLAASAHASSPSTLMSVTTTPDRFQPTIVYDYAAPVTVTTPASQVLVQRVGDPTAIPVTVSGSGTSEITVQVQGTLAAGREYTASLTPDGDAMPDERTWTTRKPPSRPDLHIKLATSIPADALAEIAHQIDQANVFAVPRAADFVDLSAATGRALTSADLTGYQACFVVATEDLYDGAADANVLSGYAAKGHGVVLAGQTHWPAGGAWSSLTALGSGTSTWASTWSPLPYYDPTVLEGGSLQASSVSDHFVTRGLTSLTVNGPGSGEQAPLHSINEQIIARLKPSASYAYGQSLVAVHGDIPAQPGRVVDLGFNPWPTAFGGGTGGFAPSQLQADTLITRSLWWATDRIAPHDTRFVKKPANPSPFRTVLFTLAAKDADTPSTSQLRFQYRVNNGRWHLASGGAAFALYHLKAGVWYTIHARAMDSAGNKDAHPARYRFRVAPGATG